MTYGKRQFDSVDSVMRGAIQPLYGVMQRLMEMVDEDTNAFTSYMVCVYSS